MIVKFLTALLLVCTFNLVAEDTVPDLGSYEGEWERLNIQQQWMELVEKNKSMSQHMNETLQEHLAKVNEAQSKLTNEIETPPFFDGGSGDTMSNADDVNEFAKELIRDKLDEKKLEELIDIAVKTNLNISDTQGGSGKTLEIARFGDEREQMISHINTSGDLFEELLDLTQVGYDDDVQLREQYKGEIDQSVIPFEKGEIGIGLIDKLVQYQTESEEGASENVEAWATTFGQAKPTNIKERGVHDIIVDRFADDAAQVMNENSYTLQAAVYDRGELSAEAQKFPSHGGEQKVDQDKAVMETFIKQLKLTQRQTAYEGAFYARLAKHTTELAKTDLEDAALFVSIFYDKTKKQDTKDTGTANKEKSEKWSKFLDSLGEDTKKHFEEYLGIHNSAGNNPFTNKTIEGILQLLKSNPSEFAKKPFMFKQYKGDKGGDGGDLQKQKENAMKFYYEKVMRVIGLNMKFTPEPPQMPGAAGQAQKAFKKVTDFGKGVNIDGVGNWEWETENVDGADRIQRLEEEDKSKAGYNSFVLNRAKKRFEWAKKFFDIANQMRKIATNIQTMMEGTQRYRYDATLKTYTDELEENTFKSYGGGTFKNMREYYDSLSELSEQTMDMRSTPTDLMNKNAVIAEKYWKIREYQTGGPSGRAKNYRNTRDYQRKGRGGRTPARRGGSDPRKRRNKKY